MIRDLIIRSFLWSNVIASRFFFWNPVLIIASDEGEDNDEEKERDEDDDEDDDDEDFEESFFGKYTSQG